jgi:putative proteasome-type protease
MTFCLGMKVKDGLVGIADTRITSGTECIRARKISCFEHKGQTFFLMSSGLRSVRDKSLTYFEETMDTRGDEFDRLFKVVNAFAEQVRRVAKEDREALKESGLNFNIHALIGGQMRGDKEHKLFLLYPEGNWVEIGQGEGTPYHIIGASGYGKPVLDRTLKFHDPMRFALKVGCLAFDSTRISAADVDFPVDIVLYEQSSFRLVEHRFEKTDLAEISNWWQDRLRKSVNELPEQFIEALQEKLADTNGRAS